jgi:HK97 gp10 family phage protein
MADFRQTRSKQAVSITVEGVDELKDTLANLAPSTARSILRQTVHGIAGDIRDRLKARVKHRSGDLAKSIKAVRRSGSPDNPVSEVRGGSSAPYMLMLEFGTKRTKAQPFITPTVNEVAPKLTEIYREQFAKKLEKSLARMARKAKKDVG